MDMSADAETTQKIEPKIQFKGKVIKINLAGAILDIGIGKPALLHITQIVGADNNPINHVEEAIQVGQEIEVWIKRIARKDGEERIELTMIKPLDLEWREIKVGNNVKGKVVRLEKFGAFVEIGAERPGLVHISEMAHGYVKVPSDVVKEGDEIEAQIIDVNRRKKQIKLSMKALQPEPEVVVEEARRLKVAWDQLQRTYVTVMQPQCVDPGLSAIQRLLLRQLTVPGTVLTLADPEEAGEWVPFFKDYQIEAGLGALKPSRGKKRDPFLFERTHQLESQIQSLLNPRVEFGGAYLIMEPTEAFMAVDVNAGSAASGARLTADLKRKINQEAILECLRQLELRNVGGMVMMDLIDAEGEAERHYYHAFLKKILQSNFSGVFSAEVSSLGVLSLTRRRMGSSLAELLLSPCGCCGQGHVLSAASQLDLMLKEAIRSGPGEKAFQVSRPVAALMERLQSALLKVEQDFEIHLRWEIDESLNHLPNQYKKNL